MPAATRIPHCPRKHVKWHLRQLAATSSASSAWRTGAGRRWGSAGVRQFVGSVYDEVKSCVCGYLLCGGIEMLSSFLQQAPHDESRYEHSRHTTQHNTTMWTIFKWKITFTDQRWWPLQRAPGSINHQICKFTHAGLSVTNTVTSKATDSPSWR